MDAANGLGQQACHAKLLHIGQDPALVQRDRVGDDDLINRGFPQTLQRRATQNAMSGAGEYLLCFLFRST